MSDKKNNVSINEADASYENVKNGAPSAVKNGGTHPDDYPFSTGTMWGLSSSILTLLILFLVSAKDFFSNENLIQKKYPFLINSIYFLLYTTLLVSVLFFVFYSYIFFQMKPKEN